MFTFVIFLYQTRCNIHTCTYVHTEYINAYLVTSKRVHRYPGLVSRNAKRFHFLSMDKRHATSYLFCLRCYLRGAAPKVLGTAAAETTTIIDLKSTELNTCANRQEGSDRGKKLLAFATCSSEICGEVPNRE